MTAVEDLSLYHYPSCGYCHMVRTEIERMGLSLELRDIHAEPERMRELVEATGRRTVPCLRIQTSEGVHWMHESFDIVEYLRSSFGGSAE